MAMTARNDSFSSVGRPQLGVEVDRRSQDGDAEHAISAPPGDTEQRPRRRQMYVPRLEDLGAGARRGVPGRFPVAGPPMASIRARRSQDRSSAGGEQADGACPRR
jgi:hypothetical protein